MECRITQFTIGDTGCAGTQDQAIGGTSIETEEAGNVQLNIGKWLCHKKAASVIRMEMVIIIIKVEVMPVPSSYSATAYEGAGCPVDELVGIK